MTSTKLIIHVGTSKTGTTSIQGFLNKNSGLLAEKGFCFVQTGRKHIAHTPLHRRLREESAPEIWRQIQLELAEKGAHTGILSSEYFFSAACAQGFSKYMPDALRQNTHVVAYIRRQDKYLESAYKQLVKVGRILPDPNLFYEKNKDRYRYIEELRSHADAFGPASVHVRAYERNRLHHGDVVADFLKISGIPLDDAFNFEPTQSNRSLSAEATEIIGAIARNTKMNARQIMREMLHSGDAELLRSDDVYNREVRKTAMSYYEASNREICEEFNIGRSDLFDLSDLNGVDKEKPQITSRAERLSHAYEAALRAMERIQNSKRTQLYK